MVMFVSAHYEREARRLFSSAADRDQRERINPVTGGWWVAALDSKHHQIKKASRCLMAREYFENTAPNWVQQSLPLSYEERQEYKCGGVSHVIAWFSESLQASDCDFGMHPIFEPYARGVLASPYAPEFITQDQALQKLFPPRPLKGLGRGLVWQPSRASIRNAPSWEQRLFLMSDPPPPFTQGYNVVSRQDANVPDSYVPSATTFLQVDDAFVAHAARLAGSGCKRLPRGWEEAIQFETFRRIDGGYKLLVRVHDYGWIVERVMCGREEVLAYIFTESPILCDTYVTAAHLAEVAHWGLPNRYLLKWMNTT
jgi:hypothetical protein